ncbi:MAG: hypothetical protein KEFWMYNX_001245 [Candidatus Fervidibacter sp.]|jgi:hypothetical protein
MLRIGLVAVAVLLLGVWIVASASRVGSGMGEHRWRSIVDDRQRDARMGRAL